MEAIAKTRHLKGSPRKARLVIDLIRGVNVSRALSILKFTDKRAADPIEKTLRSAIANATYLAEQQNIAIDPDDLWVKTCFVDMGAHKNRRRMRPAPQGRAFREQRHYCHITILVSSEEQPQKNIKENKKGKEGDNSSGEKSVKANTKPTPKIEEKKDAPNSAKPAKEEVKVDEVETKVADASVITPETNSPIIEQEAKAEIADAKDASTQNTAELNESKPADEVQLEKNEELEKQ